MMNRLAVVIKISAALGLCLTGTAWSCNTITGLDTNYNLNSNSSPTLDIQVQRTSTSTQCDWYVTVNKGDDNDGTYNRYIERNNSNQLSIDIRNEADTETLKDLPDAIPPANVISGTFGAPAEGTTKIAKYKYVLGIVPSDAKDGNYSNSWTVKLYSRIPPAVSYTQSGSSSIGANYTVATSLDVSMVATGAPFNLAQTSYSMNFGNLTQNQIQTSDMIVYANTNYTYTLSSTNGGKLKRVGGPATTPNFISYQLSIAATAHTSAVNVTTYPYTSPTVSQPNKTELRFPISVQIIDNPATRLSGTFTDTITVTLTAI